MLRGRHKCLRNGGVHGFVAKGGEGIEEVSVITTSGPGKVSITLYELIEAVMDEVGPEENDLVTCIVSGLLEKGGMAISVH